MNTILLAVIATALAGASTELTATHLFTALVALVAVVGFAACIRAGMDGRSKRRHYASAYTRTVRQAAAGTCPGPEHRPDDCCDRCWVGLTQLPCSCTTDCGEPSCYGFLMDIEREVLRGQ